MQQRRLGKTGLDVGVIGLGSEYLLGTSRETMLAVVHGIIDRGANYIDLLYSDADFVDEFAFALKRYRHRALVAVHLDAEEEDGQPSEPSDMAPCERVFTETLRRLGTDYADVALVHMVDTEESLDTWGMEMLELAGRYRREGKVRFVGMSGHKAAVAAKAVKSGLIDVLMFPVNLAGDSVPGNAELFLLCAQQGVGLVAMKPYAGGQLLRKEGNVFLHWVQSGGESLKVEKSASMTPVQCLSYVLSQPGVSTIVPGVKNLEEFEGALALLDASEEERDYSALISGVYSFPPGTCQYCNHCLPCPSEIDIAAVMRLLDEARNDLTAALRTAYGELSAKGSACVECRECLERCPFDVNVVARMKEAAALFE